MAILTQNTYDPKLYDHIQKPYVPTAENDYLDEVLNAPATTDSSFSRAMARGTDQYQASLYGFAKTMGDVTGIDMLSKFGEEGVEANIKEIMANPADLQSWDDIESLADFGTYFVEALGEQVPQLAIDIPLLVGGTAAAGAGGAATVAARRAAMAQIGKAAKRKLGQKAFINFKRAAIAAPVANLVAQSIGETQMEFMAEDVDAPGTAIATGAIKGLIDRVGLGYVVDKAMKVGVSPNALINTTKQLLAAAGSGVVVEGATEAAQTALDKAALKYELGDSYEFASEDNINEIIESSIKGGLVGGTLSSGARGISLYHEYSQALKSKSDSSINELLAAIDKTHVVGEEPQREPDQPRPFHVDSPIPEPQSQIDAQYAALVNPDSAKKVMEITEGSPLPSGEIHPDTLAVHTKNGLALTQDRAIAEMILSTGGDQKTMGQLLYGNANGKADTDGTVVIGRDANGEIVYEEGTNGSRLPESIRNARLNAPGGRVEVTDVQTAVQDRVNKLNQLPVEGVLAQAIESVPEAKKKAPEFIQQSIDEMFLRLDPKIRAAIIDGLQGNQKEELAKAIVTTALKEATPKKQKERAQNEQLRKQFKAKSVADIDEADISIVSDEVIGEETANKETSRKYSSARWEKITTGRGEVRRFQSVTSAKNFIKKQDKPELFRVEKFWDEKARNYRFNVERQLNPETVKAERDYDTPKKRASVLVDDVIHEAERSARRRQGFLKSERIDPLIKQNAKDSIIQLRNRETGEVKNVATMDITQAGKGLLDDTQITTRSADHEYEATAFNHMLAHLIDNGWQPEGITDDTFISHKSLKNQNAGVRVRDVKDGMRKQRRDLHKLGYLEKAEQQAIAERSDAKHRAIEKQKTKIDTTSDLAKAKDGTIKTDSREDTSEELDMFDIDKREAKEKNKTRKTDEQGEKITYTDKKPSKPAMKWKMVDTKLRRQIKLNRKYHNIKYVHQRVRMAGESLGKTEASFLQHTLSRLKLPLDITVLEKDKATLDQAQANGVITAQDRQAIDNMGEGKRGMYIANGTEAIIIVPPLKGQSSEEQAQRLWIIGHELGHGVLDASLETMKPAQRARVERLYQRAKEKSKAYQGVNGYAEWFADRIANYARDELKQSTDPTTASTVSKLRALFAGIKAYLKLIRFKNTKTMNEFITEMVEQGVFEKATTFGFGPRQYMTDEQRERVRAQVRGSVKTANEKVHRFFTKDFGKYVLRPIITGDGELRTFGELGEQIANMFYWPKDSEKRGRTPYFDQIEIALRRYKGSLEKALHLHEGQTPFSEAEMKEAFTQLTAEMDYADLNDAAKAIRDFLEHFHQNFIQATMPLVGYEANYFPRQYVREMIEQNRAAFEAILREHGVRNPDTITASLLGEGSDIGILDFEGAIPPTGRLAKERKLRDPELIKALVDAGFLNANPVETLYSYVYAAIQRGSWENLFSGYRFLPGAKLERSIEKMEREGQVEAAEFYREEKNRLISEFLEKHNLRTVEDAIEKGYIQYDAQNEIQIYDPNKEINEQISKGRKRHEELKSQLGRTPERQKEIQAQIDKEALTPDEIKRINKIIRGYTGKLGMTINKDINSAQSTAMMLANWTMLGMSTISSLVEPALLFKSVKDSSNFWMAFRGIVAAISDRKELMRLYGDLGLMESHLQMEVLAQLYGYHNANSFAKKGNDILFKINGQVWFTNTSRLAAAHTGVMFIKDHATKAIAGDATSLGYLKELGITDPTIVQQWVDQGENWWTIENNDRVARVVQDAVTRFVQSSVLTPNRAERPTWGNDPRYALLWHLKGFAYTFHKTVVQGMKRTTQKRYAQGGMSPALAYLLPVTAVFLAFAAMANELREEIQYRLGGQYRPSDYMDTDKYLNHLIQNRIGVGSTVTPWIDAMTNSWGRTIGAMSLAPVVGKIDQLITSPNYLEAMMDATPLLAQNPGAQRMLRNQIAID